MYYVVLVYFRGVSPSPGLFMDRRSIRLIKSRYRYCALGDEGDFRRCSSIFRQNSKNLSRFFTGLAFVFWSWTLTAQELIVNDAVSSRPISRNEARLYFTMRLPLWGDSVVPVKVFVLPDDHPLHRQFVKSVLGLFPYQLRQVWDRQIFSGTGQAPTTVATEQEMAERVAATPGGIGYAAVGASYPRVRILEVR